MRFPIFRPVCLLAAVVAMGWSITAGAAAPAPSADSGPRRPSFSVGVL